MNPKVEILSQGSEVVTGQVIDTNAAWLSEQLVLMGFDVVRHYAVGDKLEELIEILSEIATRADCCICTGGLGPTRDDLTSEAVSTAFSLPLSFDAIAFEQIQSYFKQRQRTMPEINRKQAMLPKFSIRIDNHFGTAPAFCLQYQSCFFVFLPGVPFEMKNLFQQTVKSLLLARFELHVNQLITLKTFGIGESDLEDKLKHIQLPDNVELGFRATLAENQVKLLFPPNFPITEIKALVDVVTESIGDSVFAVDGFETKEGDLITTVAKLLQQKKRTLAVIETLSQGLLAAQCIGQSWFLESSFSSLEKLKSKLDFPEENLTLVAVKLAEKLQQESKADYVLVQLHDGSEQTLKDNKQAVVLHTVLLTSENSHQEQKCIAGFLEQKQQRAALIALDLLRRYLQQKPLAS